MINIIKKEQQEGYKELAEILKGTCILIQKMLLF